MEAEAAAKTAVPTATATAQSARAPLSGPVEEPANESEAKIFAVLNEMGIPHVGEEKRKKKRRN